MICQQYSAVNSHSATNYPTFTKYS